MRNPDRRNMLMATAVCCLSACGGGGSNGVNSTPAPPVTLAPPVPPPSNLAIDLLKSPATQEFAALGSGDLRIRYDASTNLYEVMVGTGGWTALVDDPQFEPLPGNPNTSFRAGANFYMIRAHHSYSEPTYRYQYSNLAAWGRVNGSGFENDHTAFGVPTPTGSIPLVGSASYSGLIEGISTVPFLYDGDPAFGYIQGTVTLDFNFGSGSLAGQIDPIFYTDRAHTLNTLTFTNTVFGVGSTGFSGQFATSLGGPNSFSGLFTGPNAQELIGKWAFPFKSPIDGASASAQGAWIAKRP